MKALLVKFWRALRLEALLLGLLEKIALGLIKKLVSVQMAARELLAELPIPDNGDSL